MKNVNWPHVALAAIAVGGLLGTLALILALTPAPLLDRMVDANWPAAIMGAVSLAISVVVMLRRAGLWKDGPPPGGPLLALLGVLALGAALTGCGGPIQAQSQAIRATAASLDVASDVAESWATAEMQACDDVPCVDAVEARFGPLAAGQAGVLAALATWSAGLSLYMATESESVARWMVRAAQDVITAWQAMDAAASALGHDLPDIPPVVLGLVSSLGGE